MISKSYQERADHLAAMIEDRLGVRGNGLRAKLRRAGRSLPSDVRHQGEVLLAALDYQGNPKLARRLDERTIDRACKSIESYLSAIDPKVRRMNRLVSIFSSAALALLVTACLVIAVLVWRGYV